MTTFRASILAVPFLLLVVTGCGVGQPGQKNDPLDEQHAASTEGGCTYDCALDCVCQRDANGCEIPTCVVPETLCGATACGASQYCEHVLSDVPEFSGSYERWQCLPLGACASANDCSCLEAQATCEVIDPSGPTRHRGTCQASSTVLTLSCVIGG